MQCSEEAYIICQPHLMSVDQGAAIINSLRAKNKSVDSARAQVVKEHSDVRSQI
jgi:hypothetical protein